MSTVLFIGSFGSDDPTRASLPLVAASGALEAGHVPEICLLGEAAYLMKDTVLASIQGIGFPPLSEVMTALVDHRVPVYV
jgi:predicted peroxiredoxin